MPVVEESEQEDTGEAHENGDSEGERKPSREERMAKLKELRLRMVCGG